jgi:hypothetical protein
MPLAPVNIPPGIVKAATPLQVKGRYWDGNLIRWRAGKLLPVGGWQRITASPLSSTIRCLFPWAGADNATYCAVGCESKLFVLNGSTYTDITPPNFVAANASVFGAYGTANYGATYYGLDTDPTHPRDPTQSFLPTFSWTIDNWGGDILAVASSDGRLLHWNHNESYAEEVGHNTIVNIVRTSNVATVTTVNHHGFINGQTVVISGNSVTGLNGTYTITSVTSDTTFTYANSGTNTTGTGGLASVPAADQCPIDNRGVIVTPERHAVLIGAGGNTRRVAWSSREDYTDWDFADPANTAGYLDLDTQNKITMCAPVREGTLIWTEDEAWLMRYIGLPYIYQIERIGFGCGLIAPRAFATFAGRCVWMGRESFFLYDGGTVRPLPCEVGSYVFDDVDPQVGSLWTHGSENNIFPEAWFWYPSQGSTVPNRAVYYNYAEGWWGITDTMTRTAACGSGVFRFPLASDQVNDIFQQENGWTAAGTPITTGRFAETGSINIQNGNSISHIRQAITDSGYGYDSTQLTFFSSFTPEAPETTSGPYNPRASGYTDMRVTGRDFRVKIAATEDGEWSIGEMRLEMIGGGGR